MSTRGVFWVGYLMLVSTLFALWLGHVTADHHRPTLHDVCRQYTCTTKMVEG